MTRVLDPEATPPLPRRRGVPSDPEERLRFARALNREHRRSGLSVAEFARRSGASERHIRQLEDGSSLPTVAMVLKLAAGLGIPPGRLFREDERCRKPRATAAVVTVE
jgi:transcriptional regulator with XRE-family HTH domain